MSDHKPARIRVTTFNLLLLDVDIPTVVLYLMSSGMINKELPLRVETFLPSSGYTQVDIIEPDFEEGMDT